MQDVWVLEDFVIKRTIGRGHAGYIYLALHIPTAKTYALKTCNHLGEGARPVGAIEPP
jgi:hypothetical protein